MACVFVGMSGGVDSSVAALLLQEAGHQVSGIYLQLLLCQKHISPILLEQSAASEQDARHIASRLHIPFYTADFSARFQQTVLSRFVEDYQVGRTPNPCIECNQFIKFGAMLQYALDQQGEYLATGHYAQVEYDAAADRYLLKRGADRSKDQSYFLYRLSQKQLSHVLFPLGGLLKSQVRQLAEQHRLVNAKKRDSQDICFVLNGKYADFIEQTVGAPSPTGHFINEAGDILGRHKGFIRYTKGQHKGLGLSTPEPLYVLHKNAESGEITLGPSDALYTRTLTAQHLNWISIPSLTGSLSVTAKTRYSQTESEAVLHPLENGCVHVEFAQPQRAVTPGQAVVFYQGEVVVGGGTIV